MITYNEIYRETTKKPTRWHRVVYWPWWIKDFSGFTLGNIIFVKDMNEPLVIVHELVHVEQFCAQPFTFWARYLIELYKCGYMGNKYEIEAYAVERKSTELLRAGKFDSRETN